MNETEPKIYRLRAEVVAAEVELTRARTAAEWGRCLTSYEQAVDRYIDLVLHQSSLLVAADRHLVAAVGVESERTGLLATPTDHWAGTA